ncbi:MAG: 50S ribosomal protein L11 methyltransferase [Bacteroidota bacterium]
MKEAYVEVNIPVPEVWQEPLVAVLATSGFEGFEQHEEGVRAYCAENTFDEEELADTLRFLPEGSGSFSVRRLAPQNWNRYWEQHYPAVFVDDYCQIVPSFLAPEPGYEVTLHIEPKMSFGTGHHETTRLMIRQMRGMDLAGKSVLDMGTGTGVLAILATKLGAHPVLGVDIDEWSVENAPENCHVNGFDFIEILQGDEQVLGDRLFDVILANINRKVLKNTIPTYVNHLSEPGILVISGIYEHDLPVLHPIWEQAGLSMTNKLIENSWVSLSLTFKSNTDT